MEANLQVWFKAAPKTHESNFRIPEDSMFICSMITFKFKVQENFFLAIPLKVWLQGPHRSQNTFKRTSDKIWFLLDIFLGQIKVEMAETVKYSGASVMLWWDFFHRRSCCTSKMKPQHFKEHWNMKHRPNISVNGPSKWLRV